MMMNRTQRAITNPFGYIVAAGIMVLAMQCNAPTIETTAPPPQQVAPHTEVGHKLYRYVDTEAGVICYVWNSNTRSGQATISCLPLSDTRLDAGR